MLLRPRSATSIVCSWLAVGCVGGTSATGTTDSSSGPGGSGPAGCIKVDCSVPANESTPECDFSAEPGSIGEGPLLLGEPDLRRGFVEDGTAYVAFYDGASGAIVAVDLETGARTFVSGILEDPQTGPQPRGSGPELGQPRDVGRAPDGRLYALVDGSMGRQVLFVDESTGDRAPAVSLELSPCSVAAQRETDPPSPPMPVQLSPQFEVLPNGNLLLVGDGDGGDGLFEMAVPSGTCTAITFASDGPYELGEGPRLYEFRTVALGDGKAYVTDYASDSLVEVDLVTGDRIRLSSTDDAAPVGQGPRSGTLSIVAREGSVLAAPDDLYTNIVATDLATGDREEYFPRGPLGGLDGTWLYGERDGCSYWGHRGTLYVFDPSSLLSHRISR